MIEFWFLNNRSGILNELSQNDINETFNEKRKKPVKNILQIHCHREYPQLVKRTRLNTVTATVYVIPFRTTNSFFGKGRRYTITLTFVHCFCETFLFGINSIDHEKYSQILYFHEL
jgi:hypothetical protein